MKTKQKITSLLLLSILVVSGCGKHAKPEAEGGAKKDEKAVVDGGKKEEGGGENPAGNLGSVTLGGDSEFYSTLMSKQDKIQASDILNLANKEKFGKDAEFDGESLLIVVASLEADGFHIEENDGASGAMTTSFAKYSQKESKLEVAKIEEPTKLTIGDKTLELVASEKSSVLVPKEVDDKAITGNTVKLESGKDIFEGKLPFVLVKVDNKDQLKNFVLDLSKPTLSDELPIAQILSSTDENVKNECAMASIFDEAKSKKLGGLTSLLITNFVDLDKKVISFAKLDKKVVEKLPKDTPLDVTMICSSIVAPTDQTIGAILVTLVHDITLTIKAAPAAATAKK